MAIIKLDILEKYKDIDSSILAGKVFNLLNKDFSYERVYLFEDALANGRKINDDEFFYYCEKKSVYLEGFLKCFDLNLTKDLDLSNLDEKRAHVYLYNHLILFLPAEVLMSVESGLFNSQYQLRDLYKFYLDDIEVVRQEDYLKVKNFLLDEFRRKSLII